MGVSPLNPGSGGSVPRPEGCTHGGGNSKGQFGRQGSPLYPVIPGFYGRAYREPLLFVE